MAKKITCPQGHEQDFNLEEWKGEMYRPDYIVCKTCGVLFDPEIRAKNPEPKRD